MVKSLKAVLGSLDSIPESLRDLYAKQENGSYLLQVEDVGGVRLENSDALRGALTNEREARKRVSARLSQYGWLVSEDGARIVEGPDGAVEPEIARTSIAAVKAGRAVPSKDPQEIEDLRKQITDKAARDKAEMEEELRIGMEYVHQILVDDEIAKQVRASGGTDDTIKAMLPIIKPSVRVEKGPDRKPRVYIVDEKGTQRISKKYGSTDPMTIGEFVPTLKGDRAFAFAWPGKATGGSGADQPTGGSATGGAPIDPTKMSGRQMLDLVRGNK